MTTKTPPSIELLLLDEEEKKKKVDEINRLTQMDTQEVSLVDSAANKRTFLMIKSEHEGTPMAETATKATPIAPPAPEVKKAITLRVEEALARVETVKAVFEAAATAPVVEGESPEVPTQIGREIRAIQFMLKSLAGITSKNQALLIPGSTDLSSVGAIAQTIKTESTKVLDEVATRLNTFKSTSGNIGILDVTQARAINATADLLAKIPHQCAKSAVILASSLSDDQRATVQAAIEKAMSGLCDVYVALQTDAVTTAKVADQFEVGSALHVQAATVEEAVASILNGVEKRDDAALVTVEKIREINKAINNDSASMEAVAGVLTTIAKVASRYRVRTNWDVPRGDATRHVVMLEFDPQNPTIVGHFASEKAAENEALKLNVLAVTAVAKTLTISEDTPTADPENPVTETVNKDDATKASSTSSDAQVADATATDTTKVGAAMQTKRLQRLKAAVTLYKDALGDLKGGVVPLEKFTKVAELLAVLVNELQVAKMQGLIGGEVDVRSTDPSEANLGSGVQPDTSTVGGTSDVFGEGVPQSAKDILKVVEDRVAEIVKAQAAETKKLADDHAAATAKLTSELTQLRKTRTAPSTPPNDGEQTPVPVTVAKDTSDPWEADMNNWSPSEA